MARLNEPTKPQLTLISKMAAPRPIPGSAGGRIRVILGETGSDYLYYLDEDDGDREWQTRNWTVDDGGPPTGLCRQINNMISKGRHITSVDYDCSGQWFVKGQKGDGCILRTHLDRNERGMWLFNQWNRRQ